VSPLHPQPLCVPRAARRTQRFNPRHRPLAGGGAAARASLDDSALASPLGADGAAGEGGGEDDGWRSRAVMDREIVALAFPALGALALDPILGLVDTAFIGRLGDAAPLAGVGIASVVLSISFSIFNFLAMATTPLVARAIGDSDSKSGASRVICVGLFLSVAIGCVSGTLLFFGAPRVCRLLGATSTVVPFAVAYLRARAVVSPFVLVSFVLNGAYRGLRDTKTPFFIALAANVVNLALDPLLIFSFGLGVQGAAAATSVSQVIAVSLMVASMLRSGRVRLSDLRSLPKLHELTPLLRAGAALTVRTMSILGTVAYATATASTMGVVHLAAFEITRQMWTLHAMILDSIAAAAQAMVSSLVARGSLARARLVSNRALQLGAIFGALIGLTAVAAGPALPRLFTRSAETASLAVWCIRMAALATPLNGAVFALDGVLAAANDFSYMALAIALAGLAAVAALTAVRLGGGGVVAVWGGLNVLMIARATVLFARYLSRSSPIPPLKISGGRAVGGGEPGGR
jgi:putative MATE family efflux protein